MKGSARDGAPVSASQRSFGLTFDKAVVSSKPSSPEFCYCGIARRAHTIMAPVCEGVSKLVLQSPSSEKHVLAFEIFDHAGGNIVHLMSPCLMTPFIVQSE